MQPGGNQLDSPESFNIHKRSFSELPSLNKEKNSGINLREDKFYVSKEDDNYFHNNKLYTNIIKEQH